MKGTRRKRWLFTCEHGGTDVPPEFAHLFKDADATLRSHRGWDPGALDVFGRLAPLGDAAIPAATTRLLIDLNRSLHHPRAFSEFTRSLPPADREEIIACWWRPWRARVAGTIAGWRKAGDRVCHVSVHSFTPVLGDRIRNADIGLLYDPSRPAERGLCLRWQALLAERGWRVRRNYPYRGAADGHTTALRRAFPTGYAGIELELNQALFPRLLPALCRDLHDTLRAMQNPG